MITHAKMYFSKLCHLWHGRSWARSMTKTYQKASGLINKPPATRLTRSTETFLDLWFHSVWLLWSAKSKQGWSRASSRGFELYRGPPTGIVCQSESRLTSEGVCSLTRGGLLLSVIPLSERSWEEALVADCRAEPLGKRFSISGDKTTLSALCSHLAPFSISIFTSRSVFKEQKRQRQKE